MNWLSLDRKQLANVENSLKEIIARAADEDSHTQFTPIALCQELVQKIIDQGISSEKDWLVIANLEILFVVRAWFVYNGWSLDKLHYASASDRKLKFAKCLLGNENVSKYEYDQLEKWDPGMKFDVVLGNPPYNRSLHLTFLELCFKLLKSDGKLVFVHPAIWLYVQKPGTSLVSANEIKTLIGPKFSGFEVINGNFEFGIRLFGPCVITCIDMAKIEDEITIVNRMTGKTVKYSSVFDINPFFEEQEFFSSIKNKIWNYCENVDNVHNHIDVDVGGNYFVNLENIIGDANTASETVCVADCFYDFIYTSKREITDKPIKTKGGQKQFVNFTVGEQAENFRDYLTKSKFSKFTLMIVKVGQHLSSGRPTRFTPFFNFMKSWSEEDICVELGLTENEYEFIKTQVNNFYSNYPTSPYLV